MPHPNSTLRVLITGAAGRIGRTLRDGLAGRYALLRLADIAQQDEAGTGEELVTCDVADMAAVERAVAGIDVIVHLAAVPDEDDWDRLLPANISGTYNLFEAARRAGVRRVIFASSNHAVGFHRRARPLDEHDVPRPDSRYGVTKVFGEAVGRLYADKHGMQVASLRIGSFQERPRDRRQLMTWISPATWCVWSAVRWRRPTSTTSRSTASRPTAARPGGPMRPTSSATIRRTMPRPGPTT